MSLNIIKDIESFFSSIESSIAGKLSGASADVVKKTVAIAHVAEHLAATFASDVDNTWEKLDAQTPADIVAGVVDGMQAGKYEQAALGVVYLIYQAAVEATNKIEAAAAPIVAVAEAKTGGIVQKVESEVQTIWTDVKADAEAVVSKVEEVFSSAPAAAAPVDISAAAPAPEVAASVIPPQAQPDPAPAPVPTKLNLAS